VKGGEWKNFAEGRFHLLASRRRPGEEANPRKGEKSDEERSLYSEEKCSFLKRRCEVEVMEAKEEEILSKGGEPCISIGEVGSVKRLPL